MISVSDKDCDEDRRYWITCLGTSGKLMAGNLYYTLAAAMTFPASEFGLTNLLWEPVHQKGSAP
jgi:hypothetical protein